MNINTRDRCKQDFYMEIFPKQTTDIVLFWPNQNSFLCDYTRDIPGTGPVCFEAQEILKFIWMQSLRTVPRSGLLGALAVLFSLEHYWRGISRILMQYIETYDFKEVNVCDCSFNQNLENQGNEIRCLCL